MPAAKIMLIRHAEKPGDDGAPGPRPQYGRRYYAAYMLKGNDLLVNKVDVVDIDQAAGLARGKLRGPVPVADTSLAEIGHWMTTP